MIVAKQHFLMYVTLLILRFLFNDTMIYLSPIKDSKINIGGINAIILIIMKK